MLNKTYLLCYLCLITTCVNLVSCLHDQNMWHSYQFGTGAGNREQLLVSEVIADTTFELQENVLRWKSVNLGNTTYIVGLMPKGFCFITAELNRDKNKFLFSKKMIRVLNSPPIDFDIFNFLYQGTLKQGVGLVVTFDDPERGINIYTLDKNHKPKIHSAWRLDMIYSQVKYFRLSDDKHQLLLVSDDTQEMRYGFHLYEFTLEDNRMASYWLRQSVELPHGTSSAAISTRGSHVYLSVPQREENRVIIYKFSDNRFQFFQNITSKNVSQIHSFKMGFKSFLAVGGEDAGIYKITNKGFVWEEIDGLINLNGVDFWTSIPVNNYKDEVVLIAQRSIHHETHTSFFVEVAVYSGNRFVKHEEISCTFYGDTEHGLACMIDTDRSQGLFGLTAISIGYRLGLLVPHVNRSEFFMVHTTVETVKSPIEIQTDKLLETREILQNMITDQQNQIKRIQNRLQNSVKINESNYVSAPWKINTLSAPVVKQKFEEPIPGEALKLEEINVQELRDKLDTIRSEMDGAKHNMLNAVLLNKPTHQFDELSVNGEVQVSGESIIKNVVTDKLNDELVEDVFKDLVRNGDKKPIMGHKTFTNVNVESMNIEFLNDVDVRDKIINIEAPLILSGNRVFQHPVTVTGDVIVKGLVNGYNISNEFVETNKVYPNDKFNFNYVEVNTAYANNIAGHKNMKVRRGDTHAADVDELNVDELQFPGNVTVVNINGEPFDKFLESLCFTNVKTHIPGKTIIAGDLNIEGSADVASLNDLKFPEEYVLANSEFSNISGKKMFEGTISADGITTEGTINGLRSENIVTLSTNQTLTGTFIFNDLEITENLNVKGETTGPFVNDFLSNAILTESNEVKAKVNFKLLAVEGNVIVGKTYNEVDFGEILNDVLYEDEEEVTITAIKNFAAGFTVNNGIDIDSKAINTIPISSFITKNTEQTISLQTLNGPVGFDNLLLKGLYGDVNITKLEEETVKLTGEQFISSTLIFRNANQDVVDLSATDLTIVATLNNLTAENYFFTTGESRSLTNLLDFDFLLAENIFVEMDVSGQLLDFFLKDFDERRLSYTRDQLITATYKLQELQTENMQAKVMNEEPFERFFDFQYYADKITEMLLAGNLKIKNLQVNGSIFAESLNGQDVKEFFQNSLWTNRDNNFNNVVFKKSIQVNNLFIKKFNNVDFKSFVDNLIFKSDPNPVIDSFKIFTKGFHVSKMLNAEHINDIHVDDILTKNGKQEMLGPLNIHGNVVINNDCVIHENLNNVPMEYLSNTFQITDDDTCVINDDIIMSRLAYIQQLEVEGYANDKKLDEFLPNIVYKSENSKLTEKITFENKVEVNQNMIVTSTLNDVDFSGFVDGMVFITKDALLEGPARFTQPVYIEDQLIVDNDLNAQFLRGIELESWNQRAVFINKGQIPGKLKFEMVTIEDNIFVNTINNINMDDLIPLNSNQYINKTLKFYDFEVHNDVRVGNRVNDLKLQEEYGKTLFNTGDIQTISQEIIIYGNITAGKNIAIHGLVNGNNFSNIVTTYSDQDLRAAYNFSNVTTLDSNLVILTDTINNNINPIDWRNRSVRSYSEDPQNIEDYWNIEGRAIFKDEVESGGLIGGLDIQQLAEDVVKKRMAKIHTEFNLTRNYREVCKGVNILLDIAQKQICLFKYLEILEILEFKTNIQHVHYFKQNNKRYVMITESDSCLSYIMMWDRTEFHQVSRIETGQISQVINVYDGDLLFFVTREDEFSNKCSVEGTNLWKFESDELIHLYQMEDQDLLQESLVPGTFFGLKGKIIMEFRIVTVIESNIKRYRKWTVDSDNLVFVKRGLGTGLAVTNGQKIFLLFRDDSDDTDYGYESDIYTMIGVVIDARVILSGRLGKDPVVINVGVEGNRRSLVAVPSHEETSVKGKLDFITIYEDIFIGKVFHKIPSYKPSSLVSLELGQSGETLLIFLEDQKTLQVYEYKGLEGFKHRSSAKLEASKLIPFSLPMEPKRVEKLTIGFINKNNVGFIKAVTTGNQVTTTKPICVL